MGEGLPELSAVQRAAKADIQTLHHESLLMQKTLTNETQLMREAQNTTMLTCGMFERWNTRL